MSRDKIIDEYWIDYLRWCATPPNDSPPSYDHEEWRRFRKPNEDNFWFWLLDIDRKLLHEILENE